MPTLWSNPYPQGGITAADATKGTQINPINIAGLVAAIIEERNRQQQQRQQAIGQVLSSAAKVYASSQQQGQADDAANSAMYQSQYPQDNPSYAGYQDRVPDYGGSDALRAQETAQALQAAKARDIADAWKLQNEKDLAPQQKSLLQARIDDMNAQRDERRNVINGNNLQVIDGITYRAGANGQLIPVNTPANNELKQSQTKLGNLGTGVTNDELASTDVTTPNAVQYYNRDRSKPYSTEQAQADPNSIAVLPGGATMPVSTYLKAQPYVKKIQALRQGSQDSSGGQSQAASSGPAIGTTGIVNGVPAWWDGRHWVAGSPPQGYADGGVIPPPASLIRRPDISPLIKPQVTPITGPEGIMTGVQPIDGTGLNNGGFYDAGGSQTVQGGFPPPPMPPGPAQRAPLPPIIPGGAPGPAVGGGVPPNFNGRRVGPDFRPSGFRPAYKKGGMVRRRCD